MVQNKRERLRMKLLDELYQFHVSEKGKQAIFPLNLININPEKWFALEYLAEKELIRLRKQDGHYVAKITSYGIKQMNNSKLYKKQLIRFSTIATNGI
ncbi:MAG: hypothetical protein A2189_07795 [Paenibacillus sp. RIFOXYA1_FULL_44_5]|nr:MAG: hypothetical protein A2189_07795 [Paenibacillus sp. RIFOXYA1_FULL_44_5]